MATKAKEIEKEQNMAPEEMGPPAGYWDELVPFRAFKDAGKYNDDITVGVNGKIWRIKRGVDLMIPRKVREVIMNSMDLEAKTADMITGKQRQFEQDAKIYM